MSKAAETTLQSYRNLTVRRSRPPTAAAELSTLVPSYSSLCRPAFIPALRQSQRFLLWGFGAAPGFACLHCASFKPFWPPALVHQAPPAIILAALRRFRGPALFRGLRTSSRLGAPFWPSGLTLRSSGPAFCGPLTLAVRHTQLVASKCCRRLNTLNATDHAAREGTT